MSLRLGLGVKGPVPPWAAVPPLVSPLLEFLPWAQKEQGKWVHSGTEKHETAHRGSGGKPDRESLGGTQGPRPWASAVLLLSPHLTGPLISPPSPDIGANRFLILAAKRSQLL